MSRLATSLFVFIAATTLGCRASAPSQPSMPGSTFSASSSYSAPSYDPVPVATARVSPEEKLVRPEEVMQPFTLRVREGDTATQFEALKAAVESIHAAMNKATSGQTAIAVIGVRLESRGGKIKDGALSSLLDGEVVLKLPADGSVWERAALSTGLQRTAAELAEQGLGKQGVVEVAFGVPVPRIVDPERFRDELTQSWTRRVHGFINAAQSPEARLAVVGCGVPPQVTQRPISVEQVALSMIPTCRVDVPSPEGR